jgi:hypothetical protein
VQTAPIAFLSINPLNYLGFRIRVSPIMANKSRPEGGINQGLTAQSPGKSPEICSLAVRPGGAGLSESSEGYAGVIARLNPRWRIIECRHRIQWILQYRASAETYPTSNWKGRSFCRTREALLRCCREHAGVIDPTAAAVLAALPERIDAPLTQQIGGVERCEMFANDGEAS